MGVKRGSDCESELTHVRWPNPDQDASAIPPKSIANELACPPNPVQDSNPCSGQSPRQSFSLVHALDCPNQRLLVVEEIALIWAECTWQNTTISPLGCPRVLLSH